MNLRPIRIALALLVWLVAGEGLATDPVDLGSRRELFVDELLIDRLEGDAKIHLHQPEPHEVVLTTDEPWEGNTCAYYTVFQDGSRYRMYYRGSHWDVEAGKKGHPELTCYAESEDGVHWTKPELGLFEFDDSKANNIVWDGVGTHNFAPFKDANPEAAPEARYKALGRGPGGLYAFQSADGLRWRLMAEKPVITKGAFDSQNLAFWDPHARIYREYHRVFTDGRRAIMTGTSSDFLHWSEPVLLQYGDAPKEHLYTNAVMSYPRAPHILIGFPTRYLANARQQVEPIFMASRDGRTFHRFQEAVIPRTAPKDRDGNRSNYMAWGLLRLPGDETQYSVYGTEAYYTGPDSRVRRFTYRLDGFVSLRGGGEGGELITKPISFAGRRLELNFAARDSGNVRVEVQDADGKALEGFALSDCEPLQGDAIAGSVAWKSNADLAQLSSKPIRLRFAVKDADVYSFRFVEEPNQASGGR